MQLPTPPVAPPPQADAVRRVAREVLDRDYFQLTAQRPAGRSLLELMIDFIEWLSAPLRFLFEWLYAISPLFGWLFIVLLALVAAALVAHIAYLFMRAVETRVVERAGARRPPPTDPAQYERMAEEAFGRADWITAARHLFRAALLRLARAEDRPVRAGVTNRELLRAYRDTLLFDPLGVFVEVIERKWYGRGVCCEADLVACKAAYATLRRAVEERAEHA